MNKDRLLPADTVSQEEEIQGWNAGAQEVALRFERHEQASSFERVIRP